MNIQLLCMPCTVRTAYDIALRSTSNKDHQHKIMLETIDWLRDSFESELTPATLHTQVCRITKRITSNPDPFKELKKTSNDLALRVLPFLKSMIKKKTSFEEKFRLALLGTICGNSIDFEVESYNFSIESFEPSFLGCLQEDLDIDDTEQLLEALLESRKILYLMDNAGEIVFDKMFIRLVRKHVSADFFAAVKGGPVLNDATIQDANQTRLSEVAKIVTTGTDHIGVRLNELSKEFLNCVKEADLIIAKGQGNFESIPEIQHIISGSVVFILRAKCKLIADELGVPLHGNVVKFVS